MESPLPTMKWGGSKYITRNNGCEEIALPKTNPRASSSAPPTQNRVPLIPKCSSEQLANTKGNKCAGARIQYRVGLDASKVSNWNQPALHKNVMKLQIVTLLYNTLK